MHLTNGLEIIYAKTVKVVKTKHSDIWIFFFVSGGFDG